MPSAAQSSLLLCGYLGKAGMRALECGFLQRPATYALLSTPMMLMWLCCLQACRIAKLFAKHIKVAEQQQYLQQHPLCIAAGTPNRLCKLADTEALQLSQLQLIVLDVQQDAKQRYVHLFNCNSKT